jgi:hypothetical protein
MLDKIKTNISAIKADDATIADRLGICRTCEKKKTITMAGTLKLADVCGICYCPLATITYLNKKTCPSTPSKW